MSASAAPAAFRTKLAGWDGPALIDENTKGRTPKDGGEFLFLHFPIVNRRQITFGAPGANVWREEGAARLVLSIERGAGLDTGRLLADQLIDMFLGAEFGDVVCGAPSGPTTDDHNEDGLYYQLAVVVPYSRDFFG